ncbi:Mu-like prophage major head subunit gpT family protein [Paramagnetospirillum magneticum]|uniref:Mu-like prophage major head subunit gpT n=1 Tax=Paramagnetospirillum magneticum (strain ATCC 700264 / AMB-1) TaxID=342108 RepID=Q2W6I1_PARM1|nr:Mu-like prophage major head subunit gpT family protein [Paramagnetospirillum magneticum]BAE50544.1 Mu-like prophage major head subunit gpT [Paramagnetospirillum magneticum AMB-1]
MLATRGGANLGDIFTGFNTAFNKGLGLAKPTISTVAMEVPSTTGEENYNWLGSFPMLREWVGDRVIQSLSRWSFTIKNKNFEMTVKVPGNAIEDDQYGLFSPLMTEMGREAAIHPDRLGYDLMKKGFSATCYDEKPFFSEEHPIDLTPNTVEPFSNMQAGNGTPWFLIDASRALRPLVYQKRRAYRFVSLTAPNDHNVFWQNEYVYGCDGRSNVGFGLWQLAFGSKAELNHDNFEAARAAMTKMVGDGGRKLGITPTHLICPSELEGAARRVLKNENRIVIIDNNGVSAPVQVANEWKDAAEILSTPYL